MGLQSQGVDAGLASMRLDRGDKLADLRLGKGGAQAGGTEGRGAAWSGALGGVAAIAGKQSNPLAGGGWRLPRRQPPGL
jgi:hypothetical protein